jgi:hypothetical protein
MVVSVSLRFLYSLLYRNYINHIQFLSSFWKKKTFLFFKIAIQGVSLWHLHVYVYYNPNWEPENCCLWGKTIAVQHASRLCMKLHVYASQCRESMFLILTVVPNETTHNTDTDMAKTMDMANLYTDFLKCSKVAWRKESSCDKNFYHPSGSPYHRSDLLLIDITMSNIGTILKLHLNRTFVNLKFRLILCFP